MAKIPVAVVGAGQFGRNHVRVLRELAGAELVGVVDTDLTRAQTVGAEFGCPAFERLDQLPHTVQAAVVATPTLSHAEVGCALLERGIDVLVEKPMAATLTQADRLRETAARCGRILMIGHLERFNPAIRELENLLTLPLFFEVHRLSPFAPRSLDVDVVLDLMIHDLDIVLSLTGKLPEEVRASGISILSPKVDIANVRLAFPGGIIANLTASRVSTERVRKLRLFQPHQYIAVDYSRQDLTLFAVGANHQLDIRPLAPPRAEPLRLELEAFLAAVASRQPPRVSGAEGRRALAVALEIQQRIEEHARTVAETLSAWKGT